MNLAAYWPIILYMGVGIALCIVLILLGKMLAPKDPYPEKLSTYECGFEPFGDAEMQFDVRYYLIAILFILFDLETAFLVPWAVSLQDTTQVGLIAMVVFIIEFLVGYVYIWKRGALDWE